METERITLSQRERDRMRVLHEVKQGHLTHREAGRRLRLSDRRKTGRRIRLGRRTRKLPLRKPGTEDLIGGHGCINRAVGNTWSN
jgi:hypothetical protein